jgi:alanine racemase
MLSNPGLHFDLVRCGIGVYGYYPSPEMPRDLDIRPALSLRSRVAKVADLSPGEGVAYGMTWRAKRPSRVALVLSGYGDGLLLNLTNRGVALVRGQRAPYAGRVMMDMLTLDVTDIPSVQVDDEVTLIGTQEGSTIDADEMAALAGTINYEVLNGLMERVPRLYTRGGRIVERQDISGLRRSVLHD